jgi:predicted acetyltransferase
MDSIQAVSLVHATPSDETLLGNLLELYIHDLSAIFPNVELGPEGRFGYPRLPLYWIEPERRFPFLIRYSGRIAGFILVQRVAETAPPVHDVAEFFVLRRYRRSGVGRQAAHLLWRQLAGQWTVRVAEANRPGLAFWHSAIAATVPGTVSASTAVHEGRAWQVFTFTTPTTHRATEL